MLVSVRFLFNYHVLCLCHEILLTFHDSSGVQSAGFSFSITEQAMNNDLDE